MVLDGSIRARPDGDQALVGGLHELVGIGAWEIDAITGACTWSAEVARAHGLEPSDAPVDAAAVRGLYDEVSRERVARAIAAALDEGTPYELELELTTPGGERRRVRVSGRPVIAGGRVVKLRGTFQDVTRLAREPTAVPEDGFLRDFIEHAPGAVAMLDREMRYVAVSRRYLADYGLVAQDVVGKSHYELFPEIPERWRAVHQRCLAGATESAQEDEFPRADGGVDWVDWEIRPWRDTAGAIGGIVLYSDVVTERRRAAEALRESEQRFRAVFEHAPVGVAEIDPTTGAYLRVNARLAAILGHSVAELQSLTWRDVVPPTSLDQDREPAEKLFRGELSSFTSVKPHLHASGAAIPCRITISRTELDAHGRFTMLAIVEDVTDQLAAERALREREAQLHAVVDTTSIGIAVADVATRRFRDVNAQLCELTGYSADELRTMTIEDLTHPDDLGLTGQTIDALRAGQRRASVIDKRYRRKDGSALVAEVRVRTIAGPDGRPASLVAAIDDVGARRATEQTLRLQAGALDAAANGIAITALDGVIEWVNPAMTWMTGYAASELVGSHFSALGVEQLPDMVREELLANIAAGEPGHYERKARRKDGTIYDEAVTITPIRDATGAVTHLVSIREDVTEQKRASAQLAEAESRQRLALEAGGLGTARLDLASGQFVLDDRMRALFGVEEGTLSHAALGALVHADDRAIVVDAARQAMAGGRADSTFRIVRRGGETRWLSMVVRTEYAGDGEARRPIAGIALVRDVTDEHRAAEALRESEARFRSALDYLPTPALVADEAGTVLFVNESFTRTYGFTAADLESIGTWSRVGRVGDEPVLDMEALIGRLRDAAAVGAGLAPFMALRRAKDGTVRQIEIRARLEGRQIVSTFVDLTEQLAAGRAVADAERRQRLALEAGQLGTWQLDHATQNLHLDARAQLQLGVDRDVISMDELRALVHPDDRVAREEARRVAFATGHATSTYRITRPDGELRWLTSEMQIVLEPDARGGPPRPGLAIVLSRDVTDEQRAAAALRQSEARFRSALGALPIPTGIADRDGKIVFFNDAFTRAYGYTIDDLPTTRAWVDRAFPRDQADAMIATRTEAIRTARAAGGQPPPQVFALPAKDGSIRQVEIAWRIESDLFITSFTDRTEHLAAAEALADAEERQRLALDAGKFGTTRTHLGSDEVELDARAQELFGLDRAIVTAAERDARIHPDDLADHIAARRDGERTGRASVTTRVILPGGEVRWLAMMMRAIYEGEGAARRPKIGITVIRDATEERHAAEALRASEERFRGALAGLPIPIAIASMDGAPIYFNDAFTAQYGFTLADLGTAEAWHQLGFGADPGGAAQRARFAEIAAAGAAGHAAPPRLFELIAKDGARHQVISTARALGDIYVAGFVDVTESRRAAAALAESEASQRLAIEAAQLAITHFDLVTGTIVMDARGQAMLGLDHARISRQELGELLHPDDVPMWEAATRDAYATGRSRATYRMRHTSGEYRWFQSASQFTFGGEGPARRPVAAITVSRDITDEHRADEALRESEARLRSAMAALPIPIGIADLDGNVLYYNDAFTIQYGYTLADLPRKDSIMRLAYGDDGVRMEADHRALVIAAARGGTVVPTRVLELPAKDGTRRQVSFASRSLGQVIVAIFDDITERRRAAAELAASEARQRLALEAGELGIARVDAATGTIEIDARFRAMWGFERPAIGRADLEARIHPDDLGVLFDARARADVSGRASFTCRVVRADGEVRWIASEVQLQYAGEGAARRAVASVMLSRDVTQAQRDAEALRASEARLRTVLASLPLPVALCDHAGKVLFHNAAFTEQTGYTIEEVPDLETWFRVAYPDPATRADVRATWVRDLAVARGSDATTPPQLYAITCRSGEVREFRVVTRPVGEVILGLFQDVTDERRAAAALADAEQRQRLALDAGKLGTTRHDFERGRIELDARAQELLGFDRATITPAEREAHVHPADRRRRAETRDVALANGRASTTFRVLDADGQVRWLANELSVIYEGAGAARRPRWGIGVLRDITEEHRAAEALRASEARLRTALASMPIPIGVMDLRGNAQMFNAAFTATYGYTLEDVPDVATYFRLAYPDPEEGARTRAEWLASLDEARRNDATTPPRTRTIRAKDGSKHDVQIVSRQVGDIILSVFHDVTDERRAAAAIAEAEERQRLALDAAELGIWRHDFDRDVIELDARAQALLDLPPTCPASEMLARAHPDDRPMIRAHVQAAILGATTVSLAHRIVTSAGDLRWVAIHVHVHGELGSPGRFAVATTQDITHTHQAEAALRASEERYRDLVDGLDSVIFAADLDGRITFISRAVGRLGLKADALLGRTIDDVFRPAAADPTLEPFVTDRVRLVERRIKDDAGKLRTIRLRTTPVTRDGLVVGVAGIVSDISAQRDAEEQLRAAQKMEAIGRLAGGVAHDFNNILTVILSYAELAQRSLRGDDPLREDLEEILRATMRATGLSRQLLAFSRRQVLQPEPVDLDDLVGALGKMLHRLIGEDITLELRPGRAAITTMVDRGQLEQVVMNLVVNARDAMPDGGQITITTDAVEVDAETAPMLGVPAGRYARMVVADTGTGMDTQTRLRIFEPFFTTKPQGKGTGLGLSTVYGIVAQSRGAITVDSALGEGTRFTVYLPCDADGAEAAAAPVRATASARGHETILLVEDEPALRAAVVRVLTSAGFKPIAAGLPSEALRLAAERGASIDLIVTDVVMPEMNGRELAKRLAPLCPRARILYTSGYTDDALLRSGVLGEEFLPKPFDPHTLAERIRKLLDGASEPR